MASNKIQMKKKSLKMTDDDYMNMAIGISLVSFDPSSNKKVGCVIVKNGEIVGSGNRQVYIVKVQPYRDHCMHAEHIALIEAGIMAKRATMYCTMEPCTSRNTGEINAINPPKSCCDLIIESGISEVIFLSKDNYIGHGGKEYLNKAGITVKQIIR
jgi:diaminohydroxyphosphoribosylaminopyrimidine deaminase / 5-amino-6-(5-phosphoribosylamino)uracil reductase